MMVTKYIDGIVLSGAGVTYKVIACQVARNINSVQQASVTVALGTSVLTGETSLMDLTRAQLKEEWTLKLTGSTDIELFKGYIISVPKSTSLSVDGSRMTTSFKMVGGGQRLAAMVTGAYRYWGYADYSKATSENKQSLFLMGANTIGKLLELLTGVSLSTDVGGWLVEGLASMQSRYTERPEDAQKIKDEFDLTEKITFSQPLQDILDSADMETSLAAQLINTWTTSGVWTALMQMCRGQLFLNIVPRGHKLGILPAFPWAKQGVASLAPGDILSARDESSTGALQEDVEAIFVEVNMISETGDKAPAGGSYITYPDMTDVTIPPSMGVGRVVSVPAWLQTVGWAPYKTRPKIDSAEVLWLLKNTSRTAAPEKEIKELKEESTANEPIIGGIVAKAFFAEAKNRSITVSLMVPWWRFDFMNLVGYVIRVEDIDIGNTGKKETIYGLLSSLTFQARSSGDGSLAQMQLGLSHVRDDITNEIYGMDENPLYGLNGEVASMEDGGTGISVDNFSAAASKTAAGIDAPFPSMGGVGGISVPLPGFGGPSISSPLPFG